MIKHQHEIDFFILKYYQQDLPDTFYKGNRFLKSSVQEIGESGVDYSKIVVAKFIPVNKNNSESLWQNGCVSNSEFGFDGGFAGWFYREDFMERTESWGRQFCKVCESDSIENSTASDFFTTAATGKCLFDLFVMTLAVCLF